MYKDTYHDNSLFSESEQNRLRQFLDGFEDQGSSSPVAPVQLSSTSPPFHAKSPRTNTNSAGGIQINTLFIQPATSSSKSSSMSNKKGSKKPYDKQKRRQNSPHSSTSSIASDEAQLKPRSKGGISKKKTVELLSDDQKRANHIASEQKRRANIRIGFEKLVDIVPTLSNGHRSEALILQKSVEHLRQLVESKTVLKEKARKLQLMLGEIPDEDSSEGEIDYDF
ncbi:helix-loop-helix DNA-binding domain-containing transcription factor [Mucor lusitanicus]|uniref:Helix-loop-helix DNA-binding domain-containing transcription factor n=1 Tax=Mucor circinelloides f. lusitanicus TaxID=29924 RepID=A0A8H4BS00_MUCCL|nr:helix-loop-helix DNA-binding domain-containing transcription factor [Mucor lusitanicus]